MIIIDDEYPPFLLGQADILPYSRLDNEIYKKVHDGEGFPYNGWSFRFEQLMYMDGSIHLIGQLSGVHGLGPHTGFYREMEQIKHSSDPMQDWSRMARALARVSTNSRTLGPLREKEHQILMCVRDKILEEGLDCKSENDYRIIGPGAYGDRVEIILRSPYVTIGKGLESNLSTSICEF